MSFEQWQSLAVPGPVRFFSLARYALVEALKVEGVGVGDRVLLPEFTCRDVLASLHALGAKPVWYPVGADLHPAIPPEEWPEAKAVVAVNYFGFPQPLDPFQIYAKRAGALLIEDNAHGFLSRDEAGQWLGTRADVGLFSLRKTLPLSDGAMLVAGGWLSEKLSIPLPEAGRGLVPAVAAKAKLRGVPVIGKASLSLMTAAVRGLRFLSSGQAIAPSRDIDEEEMPCPPAPHIGLSAELTRLDVDGEIRRRRALYLEADAAAGTVGISPIFQALPEMVAPYGYAFRCGDGAPLVFLTNWAKARCLDLFRWPDLPTEVRDTMSDFHKDVRVINFL